MTVTADARAFLDLHATPVLGNEGRSSCDRYETNRIQVNWLADAFKKQQEIGIRKALAEIDNYRQESQTALIRKDIEALLSQKASS